MDSFPITTWIHFLINKSIGLGNWKNPYWKLLNPMIGFIYAMWESPTRAPSAALVARRWRNHTLCLSSAFKTQRCMQHLLIKIYQFIDRKCINLFIKDEYIYWSKWIHLLIKMNQFIYQKSIHLLIKMDPFIDHKCIHLFVKMNPIIDKNESIYWSKCINLLVKMNPFIGAGKCTLVVVKPKQMDYSSYEVISNGSGGSVAGWDGRVVIVTWTWR